MDWDKVEQDLERTEHRIDDPRTPREETLNLMALRGTLRRLLKSRSDAGPVRPVPRTPAV